MKVLFFIGVGLIATKLLLVSCVKEHTPIPSAVTPIVLTALCSDTVKYAQTIEPLMNQSCATTNCHDASTQTAGFDLSNWANVSANAQAIIGSMHGTNGVPVMPLGAALPDSVIQKFQCWVDQGKLNN